MNTCFFSFSFFSFFVPVVNDETEEYKYKGRKRMRWWRWTPLRMGHAEYAVGRLQAMVEFACFGPSAAFEAGAGVSWNSRSRLTHGF